MLLERNTCLGHLPRIQRDPHLALVAVLFRVNFLCFSEKGLSTAYRHWTFLPRDPPLLLVRWRHAVTSQPQLPAPLLTRSEAMLVFSPRMQPHQYGHPREMFSRYRPGSMKEPEEAQDWRRNVHTLCISSLSLGGPASSELWCPAPILLPVGVNSFPTQFFSLPV